MDEHEPQEWKDAPEGHQWCYTGRTNSRTHISEIGNNEAVCGSGVLFDGMEAILWPRHGTAMCHGCERWLNDSEAA